MKEYRREKVISFFLSLLILPLLNKWMHWSQTKDYTSARPLINTTFYCFEKEFQKVDWIYKPKWRHSLFTERYWDSTFHASIIQVNNEGYILTVYGYMKAKRLRDKKIKELRDKNEYPKTYQKRFC